MKKVAYISGPMTGLPYFNKPNFHNAAERLRKKDYATLNPATLPAGLTQLQYMSICQPMVMCATHIFMLRGWKKSEGAMAELALANKIELQVIYE